MCYEVDVSNIADDILMVHCSVEYIDHYFTHGLYRGIDCTVLSSHRLAMSTVTEAGRIPQRGRLPNDQLKGLSFVCHIGLSCCIFYNAWHYTIRSLVFYNAWHCTIRSLVFYNAWHYTIV